MHILITGGAGFFGSHLVDACLREHEVTVLDNFSTGRRSNLNSALKNPRFHLVEGDIRDSSLIRGLIQKVDLVYHYAAAVGVRNVIQNPIETLTTNTEGTREIFSACAQHHKKVIFASTSEVYGKSLRPTLSESDDVILGQTSIGRWGYACSKVLDEFLAYAYGKEHGLKFVIVRYFNVVGPRQSAEFGMVLPRLVKQAVQNEPLTIFGSGKQSRCFMHVTDAVNATIQLSPISTAEQEVVNVGNPQPITILELANRVLQMTKSKAQIQHLDPQGIYDRDFADMEARTPDISKLKKLVGFSHQYSLDDAIRNVANEFQIETLSKIS
jgi:UDP-glucose 4-epimerase